MQKYTLKIVAILTTLLLVGTMFIPTLVYASEEIQDQKTSQENVLFNATVQNKYEAKLNLLAESTLELNLSVKNTGYLKDINVTLEGNNYDLVTTKEPEQSLDILTVDEQTTLEQQISSQMPTGALDTIQGNTNNVNEDALKNATMGGSIINQTENKQPVEGNTLTEEIKNNITETNDNQNKIKAIKENVIELNEIKFGETANIKLPIKFKENDKISVDEYNKESTVTLSAIYVNEKGKEKKVTKTITHKIEWTLDVTEKIEQKLTRYLKYNNNTMIGVEINDEIEPNNLPITKKEISIITPKVNNINPEKIIALTENAEYKYENGIVTIIQESKPDNEGKISINSKGTYRLIYIYNTQVEEIKTIETSATAQITTIKEDTITGTTTQNTFDVTEQIGSLVDLETIKPESISKGYMYTNLNKSENKLTTSYEEKYNVNIGLAELVDRITLEQKTNSFTTEQGYYDITDKITTKKIKVENLEKILGVDGKITIKNQAGEEIAALSKEKQEAEITESILTIETTKPIAEGNLQFTLLKEISGDVGLNIEELKTINKLTTQINVKGYKGEIEISNQEKTDEIALESPKSTATLEVSQSTLSTVTENKDIIFNVVLNKSSIENALYKNPSIKITLPDQVKEIKVKDARVLYENEISAGSINTDNNTIQVNLQGTQTEYSSSATEKGSLVRIVADIKLDNLATSDNGNIKLNYANEATGENNTIEGTMKVEAPTGFVTTNTIKIDDKEATAVESNNDDIEIARTAEERKMQIKGVIINNLGNNAEGLTIIGRIPFQGNKTLEGKDLGTTVDTTLSTAIAVTGLENALVYYSDDKEAGITTQNWSTEPTTSSKTYKIVANTPLNDKTKAEFNYEVTVPANLPASSAIKENYGVYYNNNSVDGIKTNLVEAKTVGASTSGIADIETGLEIFDTNTGVQIQNEGQVTEGEYITYRIRIRNKGSKNAENVKVKATLANGLKPIKLSLGTDIDPIRSYIIDNSDDLTRTIPLIKPGESYFAYYDVLSGKTLNAENAEENQYISKFRTTINNDDTNGDEIESKVNLTEGYLNLKLTSDLQSILESNLVLENREFNYVVDLYNVNRKEKNNVTLKLQLPQGIEFVSSETKASYDKGTNTVTYSIGQMQGGDSKRILTKVKITTKDTSKLEAVATVKCTENNAEIKSNPLSVGTSSLEKDVEVIQRLSVESGKIMDTDTVEIYVDVKNNTNGKLELVYNNSMPKELDAQKSQVIIDNKVQYETTANYINMPMTLEKGQSGRFLIQAKARTQAKDSTITVESAPTLKTINGQELTVNTVKLQIQGTGNFSSGNNTNGTYNIQGTAWLDTNNNGKKEPEEERLSGVELQLYDGKKGELVKDSDGNTITVTTGNEGIYTFKSLKPGKYNIVANYDTRKYDLGQYKVEGVAEGENSDFVLATLQGKEVASTDAITIQNANIYNIDLALVDKNTFDLKLDKTITKIVVTNSKTNKTNNYDFNSNVAKVELGGSNVEYNTILVEYKITVSNIGHVAGYAKSIVDYLPKDMTFSSELNSSWYTERDGNAYNTSLANTLINPGETKEVTLVLSKKITGENLGTIRNTAEIAESYNEYSIKDINSTAGNKQDGENDMSSADAIIGMSTGREIIKVTGISIGLLALIALAVFSMKKIIMPKFTL